MTSTAFSRRTVLKGFGLGVAGATAAFASGCNLVGKPDSPEGGGDAVTLKIAIVPDPSGASEFYRAQFDQFTEKTGVMVDMIENPTDQQLNAIELMFQQGNAPDVFRAQGGQALDRLYPRGWLADLTDRAEKSGLEKRFGEGTLNPRTSGLHREGKLYSLPLVSGQWSAGGFLVWNKELLAASGATEPPSTFEDWETLAREMTKKGAGKYYGAAIAGMTAPDVLGFFAQHAPAAMAGTGIDLRNGEVAFAADPVVSVVDTFRKMQADKVFQPGWESWDGARVFTEFAKGKHGMYHGGGWNVNEIKKLNPDLDFGVAPTPIPAKGRGAYYTQGSSFSPIWSMSAQSKHPDEAWQLMDFMVSPEFQQAYFETFRTFTAVPDAWRDNKTLTEQEQGIITAFDESVRTAPAPSTDGTPGAQKLMAGISAKPELGYKEVIVPAITRNSDYRKLATAQDKKLDAFLKAEIKKIAAAGTEVSRSDLAYADWNPLENWKPSA